MDQPSPDAPESIRRRGDSEDHRRKPSISRRRLGLGGACLLGLAVLGLGVLAAPISAASIADAEGVDLDRRDLDRPARGAIFSVEGFPTVDGHPIDPAALDRALDGLPLDRLTSVDQLRERLRVRHYDLLVMPYGSAFPLEAWVELEFFLRRGGGLVVFGGAPFHQPVRQVGDDFVLGVRQPTFADALKIGPYDEWRRPADQDLSTLAVADAGWGTLPAAQVDRVFELTVRLGDASDSPLDHGSEAYRDIILRPLVHVVDADGVPRACPLLEMDRLRGPGAGSSWIFAPTDAELGEELLRAAVERAFDGPSQLTARPVYASIHGDETPVVRVMQRRPGARPGEAVPSSAAVTVRAVGPAGGDDLGDVLFQGHVELVGEPEARYGVLELRRDEGWRPGLYRVDVETPDATWSPRRTHTGFWVRDDELLHSGEPLTASRDWLRVGGEVLPVVGATYMASDVHRKFLFEPNPVVWDRDFASMRAHGVNFVRTGLWTAWSKIMLNPGTLDEAFLRALDAYVASAARHGIYLNFSFFAFQPPAYGGGHPYLGNRALDGQKDFLTLIASRFRDVHWIHWDLINEPTYASVGRLWTHQPTGDEEERRAWLAWVRERHGDDLTLLRDRWQDRERYFTGVPHDGDRSYAMVRQDRQPRKARDFALFAQDVSTEWARELRDHLRAVSGPLLVTLGQDEGGAHDRPAQQFHGEVLDYTGVHPWWQVDNMLATGVQTKIPEKPNLYQETGLMRLEDLDGWHWRTPEHAARALERKYAYSFASRGAGAINWAWNINPNMAIDNETVIGFFRPDGTAKPELRVIRKFADFFADAQPHLDDYEPADVVAVIPHSRLWMGRPAAIDGFRRLIRLSAEALGVVPLGLSELRLTADRLASAKVILVPSPEVLDESAAAALLEASRAGSLVVFTGMISGDVYGEVPPSLDALGLVDAGRPVALREESTWTAGEGEATGWVTFDRGLRENLRRSLKSTLDPDSKIWHEPLPLDHAREEGPIISLLEAAYDRAGVETHPSAARVAARVLTGPSSHFAILVNESAEDLRRTVHIEGQPVSIHVEAGRSSMVLFARGSGEILAQTPGANARPRASGP
ncbi:MAG: hypothetical protein AAGM22_26445 [Acidobacteriota bacterium]